MTTMSPTPGKVFRWYPAGSQRAVAAHPAHKGPGASAAYICPIPEPRAAWRVSLPVSPHTPKFPDAGV